MRILAIDDDVALGRSLQIHLARAGHQVDVVYTVADALDRLIGGGFDLAFVDLNLPDGTGLDILGRLRDIRHNTLSVMITGAQDSKSTIEALRLGAFDFIRKPLDLDAVMLTVDKATHHFEQGASGTAIPIHLPAGQGPHEIVGAHPGIIDVLKQIAMSAESRIPVLIQGETGTGKELVARALHQSGSPSAPFVAVNCSAVVSTLLESELFGHAKGAFTGADTDKPGKMEIAGDGTIFFDEIGDMSYDLQAKLLRVLQEKEFERVGSSKPIAFRARVVAATHRNLKAMANEKKFRDDLYYRLAVSTIEVPPLRERQSDIPKLAENMLARLGQELHKEIQGIDEPALKHLSNYDWPGNIRELNNVLTRAVLLVRGPIITESIVHTAMGHTPPSIPPPGEFKSLREAEKDHVLEALSLTDWNISKASELLDITRVTLRKKIEDYGLARPGAILDTQD